LAIKCIEINSEFYLSWECKANIFYYIWQIEFIKVAFNKLTISTLSEIPRLS